MKAIFTLFVILVMSKSVFGECSEVEKKALVDFDKAWTEANSKGDPAAIAVFYADEFTVFPALTGKNAAIDAAVAASERNKANPTAATRTTADHYMINCTPSTATIVHRNVIFNPAGNGGNGATTYGRSVHFLEKRDGKWVAVSNAGGSLSDADMLRYMELDWMNAFKNKDVDWLAKNFATDFTDMSSATGAVMNKQQMIDGMRGDKTVYDAMDVSDMNIRIDGNAAIATGIWQARGKADDGKPFQIKTRYTDVFVKRDGRWLAWSSQSTVLPEPAATAKN